jgi:hypothetical protein
MCGATIARAGARAARRQPRAREPPPGGAPGFGPVPVPGRIGVTFGYWNWWIIIVLL